MALCPKCRKRIAKRSCAALGGTICQRCCGTLREREIRCPGNCPHLAAHRPYQEKRIIERRPADSGAGRPGRKDILHDERLAWLAVHIEAALAQHAANHLHFVDKDALLALEYARERTGKGSGRLIIPGETLKPANEAGETVFQAVDTCRYQGSVVLASGLEAYKKGEKLACLERVASGIRAALSVDSGGRVYLDDLSRRFARSGVPPQGKKLITLT